uniref:hypothetical protein n=1 Tax=Occallatibacter savannae TaxID=1002691 RepID=UPI00194E3907
MFEQESWLMFGRIDGWWNLIPPTDSQQDSRYASVSNSLARTNCLSQSRVLLRLDNAFRFID